MDQVRPLVGSFTVRFAHRSQSTISPILFSEQYHSILVWQGGGTRWRVGVAKPTFAGKQKTGVSINDQLLFCFRCLKGALDWTRLSAFSRRRDWAS
jgi:hypothetical protein